MQESKCIKKKLQYNNRIKCKLEDNAVAKNTFRAFFIFFLTSYEICRENYFI